MSKKNRRADRAEAAVIAAVILSAQIDASPKVIVAGALPKRRSVSDVVYLAQWIVDGTDPLAAFRDEATHTGGIAPQGSPGRTL